MSTLVAGPPATKRGRKPRGPKPYEPTALLFNVGHAVRFLGVGDSKFRELARTDPRFPRAIPVPGSDMKVYRREDLEAYVRSLKPVEESQS